MKSCLNRLQFKQYKGRISHTGRGSPGCGEPEIYSQTHERLHSLAGEQEK